MSTRHNYQGEM